MEKNATYAERFWQRQPESMKESMRKNIRNTVQRETLTIFVDSGRITEYEKASIKGTESGLS